MVLCRWVQVESVRGETARHACSTEQSRRCRRVKALNTPLNRYGDTLIQTTGSHGADISIQRMDDLDITATSYALELRKKKANSAALDLGCGGGVQGLRFASL